MESSSMNMDGKTGMPVDVAGWNWAAFLLNWIWAIGNSVWIGLLALIPGIGFVVAIYLGIKGNELAWKSRRWASVSQFKATQRAWTTWAIALCVLAIVGYIAMFAMGSRQASTQLPSATSGIPANPSASSPATPSGQVDPMLLYPGAKAVAGNGTYQTSDSFPNVVKFYSNLKARTKGTGNSSEFMSSDENGNPSPSGNASFSWQLNGKAVSVQINSQNGTPTDIVIAQH